MHPREIVENLKVLAAECDRKSNFDKYWHYYNRECSDEIVLDIESPILLFDELLKSSYTEETFEGGLSPTCYLSFKYMIKSADPSIDFRIVRILNSSKYLPIKEEWDLSESEFLKYLENLIEKDNSPMINDQFANTLYYDLKDMIEQVEAS